MLKIITVKQFIYFVVISLLFFAISGYGISDQNSSRFKIQKVIESIEVSCWAFVLYTYAFIYIKFSSDTSKRFINGIGTKRTIFGAICFGVISFATPVIIILLYKASEYNKLSVGKSMLIIIIFYLYFLLRFMSSFILSALLTPGKSRFNFIVLVFICLLFLTFLPKAFAVHITTDSYGNDRYPFDVFINNFTTNNVVSNDIIFETPQRVISMKTDGTENITINVIKIYTYILIVLNIILTVYYFDSIKIENFLKNFNLIKT